MTRRPVLLGALAWASVVAAASGITWWVIDSAGQQALFDAAGLPPVPAVSSPASGTPARTTGPDGPSPQRSPTAGSPSSGARTSAAPAYTERAWEGEAGIVVARCSGTVISLRSATPSDEYRVEVGSRGPEEVEVTFGGEGGEVKVRAECAGGVPSFRQESESAED